MTRTRKGGRWTVDSGAVFIGTSGWTYNDWAEKFYPREVKGSERLAFYVTRFDTVEINATFYRLPTQTMLDAWNGRLRDGFHLVVKGSRVITHLKKLLDCRESLELFLDKVKQLRALRAILWQLPPSLGKDIDRLERFLSTLPQDVRLAVEFRHKSWWDDEVAALLTRHGAAFVAISHPKLPNTIYPTADFLYLRFHGLDRQLYRYDYTDNELADWANRLKPYLKARVIYAFFNNDYQANAPRNARTFRTILGAK
ncbi:MAG: DUF72 domain-containing protein [Thermoguttaceae bacterium]